MEMKNMAYWKAKNSPSPAKQKRKPYEFGYTHYEGDEFKNPKGQSQKHVLDKRANRVINQIDKVNTHAKKHGLSEEQQKKAQKKADSFYKDFTTSRDSVANVNKAYEIKIKKQKKAGEDAAGDLFD